MGLGVELGMMWAIWICAVSRAIRSSWVGMFSSVAKVHPGTSQLIGGGGDIVVDGGQVERSI